MFLGFKGRKKNRKKREARDIGSAMTSKTNYMGIGSLQRSPRVARRRREGGKVRKSPSRGEGETSIKGEASLHTQKRTKSPVRNRNN